MLKKDQRLTAHQFDLVYEYGTDLAVPIGRLRVLYGKTGKKLSCTVSSSEVKTSVARTRIRRRGYEAVRAHLAEFPDSTWAIWFLPPKTKTVDFANLSAAFEEAVTKL